MKILVAGDFCPRYRVAEAFEAGDYSSILSEVCDLTSRADYSIINLECPVVINKANPINKCGPNLRCTPTGVKALKYCGFDCTTLANNHFMDYGEDGVKDTLTVLREYNIDYVGGGENLLEASNILYKTIDDQILAIINCCEHEFSIATINSSGCNPLNPVKQYQAILEARTKANKVLVIVHGGHEHFQLPSPRMVETYRFFIDAGADVVINHHQHCYSGYEIYKGKPIFYGLGNFCFDNPLKHSGIWTEGYAVTIDFANYGLNYTKHPYRQCGDLPKIEMLPKDTFQDSLLKLNEIIADELKLHEKINQYYSSCSSGYGNVFEPINNHLYLSAKRRGWLPSFIGKRRKLMAYDFVLCESHRDKLQFWFEKR